MMSIERSGSPAGPKVNPGVESASSKGKVKPGDGSEGSTGTGFLALMTSLAPQAVAADSGESALAQAPSSESSPVAVAVADAPETDQSDNLAMLMAQACEVAGDKNSQTDAVPQALGVAQVPDTLIATTPLVAADAKVSAPTTTGDPAPVLASVVDDEVFSGKYQPPTQAQSAVARSVLKSMTPSAAIDKADIAVEVLDSNKTAVLVKADVVASALLDRTKQAMAARAALNLGTGQLQSAAATIAVDSRSANVTSVLHDLASTPTLASAIAASGWSEGLIRPSDRPGSKLTGFQSTLGVEGAGSAHYVQPSSRGDLPSVMVNPTMPSFESTIAEKLSYWISQGVQNAELEVDGFGDEPVAVRISLKGDEAHIAFRTDQPEVRRMLEGASAQLKDLLANEGLLLSQVSVGTSGQDGSGQQERRPPPGLRTADIKSTDAVASQAARRPGTSVGTAVDLFV